jgi:hypothetical protein
VTSDCAYKIKLIRRESVLTVEIYVTFIVAKCSCIGRRQEALCECELLYSLTFITDDQSSIPDRSSGDIFFVFAAAASRPALGPTQRPGGGSDHSPAYSVKLRMRGAVSPLPHTSSRCDVSLRGT